MLADHLPEDRYLLADKAYDADHWRAWLKRRRIQPVIPKKANRKQPYAFNPKRYRGRNVIERMFGRLKDWRRIHTRYDRCAHTFFSAICIAAFVIFWINQ